MFESEESFPSDDQDLEIASWRTAKVVAEALAARQQVAQAAHHLEALSFWDRLTRYPAEEILAAAIGRVHMTDEELGYFTVGADPHLWGLLSTNSEEDLASLIESGQLAPELANELAEVHRLFPDARLAAYQGDRRLVDEATARLAAAVQLRELEDDKIARRIVQLLPGSLRPIPVDTEPDDEYSDGFAPRYFHYASSWSPLSRIVVSRRRDGQLALHDIVVDADHAGRGLGSAVLEHLCRTADHYGLSISGIIVRAPIGIHDTDREIAQAEQDSRRLASWYTRHGFVVTPNQDGTYYKAKIKRPPQRLDRGGG